MKTWSKLCKGSRVRGREIVALPGKAEVFRLARSDSFILRTDSKLGIFDGLEAS